MRKFIIIFVLLLIFKNGFSQANNLLLEEIIEQIAEENEDELDYSELHEALYSFAENPINLNNLHNFIFEIGIQKQLNRELVLGAHIFNPTTVKLNEEGNIPSLFKIGLRYNANQKVSVFTEGHLENNQNGSLHLGVEYKIIKEISLRTGFSTNPTKNSFGVGYTLSKIEIDVSVNKHQDLGYSPQLSVSSRF